MKRIREWVNSLTPLWLTDQFALFIICVCMFILWVTT